MSTLVTVRSDLKTALEGAGRVVYDYPRENITAPAIVVVPGSPYITPLTIGASTSRVQVRFSLTACVNPADNQAALANLETLMLAVLSLLPVNVAIQDGWTSPQISTVGNSEMLTSQITIDVATTIT